MTNRGLAAVLNHPAKLPPSESMTLAERRAQQEEAEPRKRQEMMKERGSEDGLITADDFRDFTFANAVRLWGAGNPGFFKRTVVEKAAAAVAETPGRAPASPGA